MTSKGRANAQPPVIWLLTDQKPGHRNQLKGLGNRLKALTGASIYWLDARTTPAPWWRALFGLPPHLPPELPPPDLVIAAGSATHRLLLSLRRYHNARTLVLMRPLFPLFWVDGAIIPAHDGVKSSTRVFVVQGAINSIAPMARITSQQKALLLVGGPCPHFDWEDATVLEQVNSLLEQYSDWHWTISGSRRTPETLQRNLEELASPGVTVVDPQQTHEDWLSHQLAASRAVWVTPDSMSMVCEAATSGVPTGLLELPARPGSRVALGVRKLCELGYVTLWRERTKVMSSTAGAHDILWEADRAARWIIDRGFAKPVAPTQTRNHS